MKETGQQKPFLAAMYLRLSREDSEVGTIAAFGTAEKKMAHSKLRATASAVRES